MESFLKEFADDFLAIQFKSDTNELGLRIGNPILRHAFDKLPTKVIRDTRYNRQKLKHFKFEGVDIGARELLFYARLRIQKFTDKTWPLSGTWEIYDNAWDLTCGLRLEVENKSIQGKVLVHDTNSDWPGGIGGIIFSVIDLHLGALSWIIGNDFTTLSDIIGDVAAFVFDATESGKITTYVQDLTNMNKSGLIYLRRTDYERKGFWMWFALEEGRLAEAMQRIEDQLRSRSWL
jgi:hypothetical protein